MNVKLYNVLSPKMKFEHTYDFGSSTILTLKVISEYEDVIEKEKIKILSRNDPPKILCGICGKNSVTHICDLCSNYSYEGWLCDDCAKEHKCEEGNPEFYTGQISNSPRIGVCVYI